MDGMMEAAPVLTLRYDATRDRVCAEAGAMRAWLPVEMTRAAHRFIQQLDAINARVDEINALLADAEWINGGASGG